MLKRLVSVVNSVVNRKGTCLGSHENHIARLPRPQRYTLVEVVDYGESMRLNSVIVPNMNSHILSDSDIDLWPRPGVISAAIVP